MKNKKLERDIEKAWKIGDAKIEFASDEGAVRYACKGIGKGSQIDDTLKRVRQRRRMKKNMGAFYFYEIKNSPMVC